MVAKIKRSIILYIFESLHNAMFVITAKEHYIDGNDNKVKIHSFVKFWQIGMKSVTVNV